MQSFTAHDRPRDESCREGYSPVPVSPELTRDEHTFDDRQSLSQQHAQTPSPVTGSVLRGDEPRIDPEMATIGPTSRASMQLTISDANRSSASSSVHYIEGPEEVVPSTFASCPCNRGGPTEPDGPRLPSRTTIQRDFSWCLAWLFDIVLTIIPLLFLGMTVAHLFSLLPGNTD